MGLVEEATVEVVEEVVVPAEAIATRPSNDARLYYFISLQTRRRINQHSWTSLLMPEDMVSQVRCLRFIHPTCVLSWSIG